MGLLFPPKINMDVDSLSNEKYNVKSLQDPANVTKPSTSSSQPRVRIAEERKAGEGTESN